MISVFSYNRISKEQDIIEKGCRRQVAKRTEDKLNFTRVTNLKEYQDVLSEALIDIIYYEVMDQQDIDGLKQLRRREDQAVLMILTLPSVSPMRYLRPGIAPDMLLLRPFAQEEFDKVNTELFDAFMESVASPDLEDNFVLNSRDGKTLIPYGKILFFEASNKKINLRMEYEEYDFYDSIENLRKEVPDYFVRCHRSYLVNTKKIKRVKMADGLIEMAGQVTVPLSRTYKQDLKRLIK